MPILELDNAGKSYGSTQVLSGISLSIEPGEFVAIVGFSGAGKSTLMSLLSGLEKPDTGRALFHDAPIKGPGPERGVVFQNYSLLPWLTAFENVALAVDQVFGSWSAGKRKDHVDRYLNMVGLSHARERRPAQLSGGMRQRVALARALATEPEVLLMDEPLGALDALTRATMQDELERISRIAGKTIVLVTNDVDEAILLADRIIPLSAGPAATLGPVTEVAIARPRDRKRLNHEPQFRHLRVSIIEYLMDTKRAKQASSKRPPATPILMPALEPSA
jgi:nitrate/nitrite transport system ATP-binding protein